mmetsp:Transcript_19796/g.66950  ORF Transcript_19796/g.66950 Transcript_19796/m.66950 type:complete len:211 (+) Transcript_19796:892-1524(+)
MESTLRRLASDEAASTPGSRGAYAAKARGAEFLGCADAASGTSVVSDFVRRRCAAAGDGMVPRRNAPGGAPRRFCGDGAGVETSPGATMDTSASAASAAAASAAESLCLGRRAAANAAAVAAMATAPPSPATPSASSAAAAAASCWSSVSPKMRLGGDGGDASAGRNRVVPKECEAETTAAGRPLGKCSCGVVRSSSVSRGSASSRMGVV